MADVDESFDVIRRRKLTPPPIIKPKPKLTVSMCRDVNADYFESSSSSPHRCSSSSSSWTSAPLHDQCRPSSSSGIDGLTCQQDNNNESSNSSSVLPKGTVKALAEKFGGSTKNLLLADGQGFKIAHSQTLPRPPKPVTRKISYKHRIPQGTQSNEKFATMGHSATRKRNTVGYLVYGSRGSVCSNYGSSSSLTTKGHKTKMKKSASQDISSSTTPGRSRSKEPARSRSVEPSYHQSVEPGYYQSVDDRPSVKLLEQTSTSTANHTVMECEKTYVSSKGPPPPVPAKPKGYVLSFPPNKHNPIDNDDHIYEEYDVKKEQLLHHQILNSTYGSNGEMTLLDHSKLELSGRIYHTVRNGCLFESADETDEKLDVLDQSFDTVASAGSDTLKCTSELMSETEENVDTNITVMNSCENYAEIVYELPNNCDQKSSSGNESAGKKSISSWDTNSSLASSSETTTASSANASLTGMRSLSQEIRSTRKASQNTRQSFDDEFVTPGPVASSASTDDGSAGVERRRSRLRLPRSLRPKSQTIDMDRLWRIKSDIRLNLSQAMGKIKLRVSTSRSNRDQKAKSTFYLPNVVSDPASISITLETPINTENIESKDVDDEASSVSDETWEFGDNEDDEGMRLGPSASSAKPLPDLVQHELFLNGNVSESGVSSVVPSSPNCEEPPSQSLPASTPDQCDNTINDIERFELVYSSRFAFSEPLYQHYRNETSGVQRNQTFSEADARGARREKLLNSSQLGSQRTLWCELPEVQEAGLLSKLKDEERKLQEAMFEVITSEASYLRSLNILITHFMACPKLSSNSASGSVISRQERKRLFSNILSVRDCSENLLCNLETRLERNVILDDVCEVLIDHLYRNCDVYVKYCSNQIYQERTLNMLKTTNVEFRSILTELESSSVCESLDLRSFLMLPMQRITRYPLLAGAILHRVNEEKTTNEYQTAERAFAIASKVVKECNEGAKRLERIEQMIELDKHFIYKEGGPKRLALISGNRWLIKQGPVVQIEMRRRSLGRPQTKKLFLFLFTDLLYITKLNIENNEKTYSVRDYCPRQFLAAEPLEPTSPQVPSGISVGGGCHLFSLTLMKNHRSKQSDYILTVTTETERTRWLDTIRPSSSNDVDDQEEKVYEIWDCPQVKCVQTYSAKQEDEMDLEFDELVNVLRKLPDGWLHGERIRDGRTGWFPSSCVVEVISDHIRAKNYRQRLKLMHEAELQMQMNYNSTLSKRGSGLSMAKIFRI